MNKADNRVKNEILLKGRDELYIGGVEEVLNFDEEGVRLRSVDGELVVEGSDIKIETLDTDKGTVSLSGRINGMYFLDVPDKKKGFFGKLTR